MEPHRVSECVKTPHPLGRGGVETPGTLRIMGLKAVPIREWFLLYLRKKFGSEIRQPDAAPQKDIHVYMSSLKKMPRWLTLFPWFVMVCALLFSAGIVVFGLHNAKRESDFTSQLTLEKGGAALISALEGALRTGMGYHWSDEVLSEFLAQQGRGTAGHRFAGDHQP